jgi:hypothetical protein
MKDIAPLKNTVFKIMPFFCTNLVNCQTSILLFPIIYNARPEPQMIEMLNIYSSPRHIAKQPVAAGIFLLKRIIYFLHLTPTVNLL